MRRIITREYSKKKLKRKKWCKEIRKFIITLTLTFLLVALVEAIPIFLKLSPYYQFEYEIAPLPNKIEILIRGLAEKNGASFVSFNGYTAIMQDDAIIDETYTDESDKDEAIRLMEMWGIIHE